MQVVKEAIRILLERIERELVELNDRNDVIGTAIVNRNGLLITSRLPRDIESRKFGAMAATMFGAIEVSATILGKERINNLTVELNDCQIIMMDINEQLITLTIVDLNINLGLILIEIEQMIERLNEICEGEPLF